MTQVQPLPAGPESGGHGPNHVFDVVGGIVASLGSQAVIWSEYWKPEAAARLQEVWQTAQVVGPMIVHQLIGR